MGHGNLWLFNMEMCCRMQISSLRTKLEECKRDGRTTCVVSPNYPAAYWNPVDGDTQKSVTIQTFPSLDVCLSWLGSESAARDKCVEMLDKNC